jgi:hypothetical protein
MLPRKIRNLTIVAGTVGVIAGSGVATVAGSSGDLERTRLLGGPEVVVKDPARFASAAYADPTAAARRLRLSGFVAGASRGVTTVAQFRTAGAAGREAARLLAESYAAPHGARVCPTGTTIFGVPGGSRPVGVTVPQPGGVRATAVFTKGAFVYRISASGHRAHAIAAVRAAASAVA